MQFKLPVYGGLGFSEDVPLIVYTRSCTASSMELKVVLDKQEEGGYTAYVPSLPGCVSQGETREEALKNIKEAIELYLEADEKRSYSADRRFFPKL